MSLQVSHTDTHSDYILIYFCARCVSSPLWSQQEMGPKKKKKKWGERGGSSSSSSSWQENEGKPSSSHLVVLFSLFLKSFLPEAPVMRRANVYLLTAEGLLRLLRFSLA